MSFVSKFFMVIGIVVVALIIYNTYSNSITFDDNCLDSIAKSVCEDKDGEFIGRGGEVFFCIVDHKQETLTFTTPELKVCKK